MFNNKTVFTLGAGASWHYGYPTGEELVKKVIEKARIAAQFFELSHKRILNVHRPIYLGEGRLVGGNNQLVQEWKTAQKECEDLARRLVEADPLVIDYFMGQNPHLQRIGKFLIAWVILECEARYAAEKRNPNSVTGADNWCRFIIHKLTNGCRKSADLHKNEVRFITFNYDTSLERALYGGLSSIDLLKKEDIEAFLSDGRILHVYGSVRNCPPFVFELLETKVYENHAGYMAEYEENQNQYMIDWKTLIDKTYLASQAIRVIDPDDKHTDIHVIEAAQSAVREASCVYILGYGFDENNNQRLALKEALAHPNQKAILFTNFHDVNQINKRVSRLLFGSPDQFLDPSMPIRGDAQRAGWYYEKSVRNVYEALALDFDSLEEQLLATTQI